MDRLLRDIRLSLRQIRRQPSFSLVVVITLALGIGVNLSVFQSIYGLLLRPIPFVDLGTEAEGGEKGLLLAMAMRHETQSVEAFDFSQPDLLDFGQGCTSCEGVAAFDGRDVVVARMQEADDGAGAAGYAGSNDERYARRVIGQAVSPQLFDLLDVDALYGRTLSPTLDTPTSAPVTVLSHTLWQQLGADPDLVGTQIRLDGRLATVVGIMPEGFHFPERSQLWLPLEERSEASRADRWVDNVLVRLKPGVSLDEARSEALLLSSHLAESYPDSNRLWSFTLMPFRERLVSSSEQEVLVLLAIAVAFVMLIACVNVTNLLLARESSRRQTAAIYIALGSDRLGLLRQRMTENLVLALLGGAMGLLVSTWSVDSIIAADPEGWPAWQRFELGTESLLFTFGLSVLAALIFGWVPALRASKPNLGQAIGGSSRGTVGGREQRTQQVLVVAQIALALTLLVAAGSVVESVRALANIEAGFETDPVLALRTQLADERYAEPAARIALYDRVVESLEALPGIEAAAATSAIPLAEDGTAIPLTFPGQILRDGERLLGSYILQTPHLFDVLDLPMLAGRRFTAAEMDDPESRAVIVSQSLAERIWKDRSPLGERLRVGYDSDSPWSTVVGVVPQIYYEEPGEETDQSRLQVHIPYSRIPWRSMGILVRATVDPASLGPQVRRALAEVDPGMAVDSMFSMPQIRRRSLWGERLQGELFSSFAILALVLSAVGIYGVMAYVVLQRVREIGLRMALGASQSQIRGLFVGRGLSMVAAGVGLGLIGAFLAHRVLGSVLYGVGTSTLLPFAGSVALLVAAASVGIVLPTRRALRVDPAITLRQE